MWGRLEAPAVRATSRAWGDVNNDDVSEGEVLRHFAKRGRWDGDVVKAGSADGVCEEHAIISRVGAAF